jgi:Tol biopolymer transport system component
MWSPDGSLIAYRIQEDLYTLDTPDGPRQFYRHSSLHVARADGSGEARLTRRDGNVLAFDWAPDSERLVISACLEDLNQDGIVGDGDRTRLYVVDLATREVRPLLSDVDATLSMYKPSWSPDGVHIAYIEGHGDPASYGDLVVVRVDDGSEVARLDVSPGAEYAWSPSGNEIAYVEFQVAGRVGYEDLFVFSLTTGDMTRATDTSLYSVFSANELNGINLDHVVWSPDGNYLAFVWRTGGKDYIVVASADGTRLSRVVGLGPGYHLLIAWGP